MQLLPIMFLRKQLLPYWLAGQHIAESWKNGCRCCARALDSTCAGDQAPEKNALSSAMVKAFAAKTMRKLVCV